MNIDSNEFKKLKKEIAIKHGYNLDNDDPILMFVTLNEFMLNQYKDTLNYTIEDLSDILINIKSDINQYIKENELQLFKRIQEINNNNVSKVHSKIKDYFQQESEKIDNIQQKNNRNIKLLTLSSLLNTFFIFLIFILLFIK